ncbi:SRPBCC domain-containing protein [Hamadaea tsunoensis]|uniref:SRPBCC domain-containing protein n=1 Tax=Hamadaea tsunoensis TaxID=53368 RepID=UPI00042A2201|nr:SRPBCC domain-containing protein [Hamadaea tsunoensis]
MTKFVYEDEIPTTPERLWAALTQGEITRRYWFDRRIESDWKIGSPVRFHDGDSDTVTDTGEVLEYEEPRRLAYSFRQTSGDGHTTRVAFDLEPAEKGVRLILHHDQLARPQDVEGWRQGWAPILTNLHDLLAAEGQDPLRT